jgi:hypothetical protein
MTAVMSQALTGDEMQALASRLDIQELPTVLAVRSRHATIERRDAARDRACRDLASRNLIVDGTVHPDMVSVLEALARPDREMALRLMTPQGIARISCVRRGPLCALARRVGDEIVLRIVGYKTELRHVVSALAAELPRSEPADIHPVGAPLQEMSEGLSGTHDAVGLADRIRAMGTEPRTAMLLGSALGSRQAFAEIVYYTLAEGGIGISRGPAAVAVFYTKRGRIVAAPGVSPVGQLWTTLKAGSDHALGQAIGQMVEISTERWEE